MKPSGHNHIDPRISYLIDAYLRESISPEEHDELDAWVGASDENMRIFEEKTSASNEKIKEDKYKKYSSLWDILHHYRFRYSI